MYYKLGKIPPKRHIQFRKKDGSLYYEELFGNEGFSSDSSLIYHIHPPTQVSEVKGFKDVAPKAAVNENITSRKIKANKLPSGSSYNEGKVPLLFNNDLTIGVSNPQSSLRDIYYKNASFDELIFVHKGNGLLKTFLGNIDFCDGDYLIIPRGIIYQIEFESKKNKILYIESNSPISFPKRYLSKRGQFLEGAPLSERDIKLPEGLNSNDEKGRFKLHINKNHKIHEVIYASHPFDVVGWDGYCYPFAVSIHNFEPITGKIHQPPPVHQIFEGNNFVVCSFCPRLFDYHPKSIPAPYNHSNIDSDEVLYYVEGDFMSRDSIECGDITLHPSGIPHGPHPGTVEKSIGESKTDELAVMVDPFNPLKITQDALSVEDENYFKSWLT
ncbi:MAG: homogentisate 1,2-dioxygenase [Flavobacteriales bacterium]|nr:homogentisate 1,2-dioxygenase [Flavobacteriales bacterium]|tara:strand:+ start:3413 stop:4564 length:1152 start_codon:yes stop_codon:yes gene_type:complete